MVKKVMLDVDSIFKKEFTEEFKGYSIIEVNQFLDVIMGDYEIFNQTIETLNEEIKVRQNKEDALNEKIIELTSRIKQLEEEKTNATPTPVVSNLSQVDILRRLSRLEQEVFNKK